MTSTLRPCLCAAARKGPLRCLKREVLVGATARLPPVVRPRRHHTSAAHRSARTKEAPPRLHRPRPRRHSHPRLLAPPRRRRRCPRPRRTAQGGRRLVTPNSAARLAKGTTRTSTSTSTTTTTTPTTTSVDLAWKRRRRRRRRRRRALHRTGTATWSGRCRRWCLTLAAVRSFPWWTPRTMLPPRVPSS